MVDGIEVRCPTCQKRGVVPPGFAGKEIHCKGCGGHFRVPVTGATPAPKAVAVAPPPLTSAAVVEALAVADDVDLAPLPPDEEAHCRERYEGRTRLSKDRRELQQDADYERELRHHASH